jgi:hypothetical protein
MPRTTLPAYLVTAWLLTVTVASAQSVATDEGLLTRAERTDFRETTRYDEVVDLARRLAERSPDIHLTTFGYTFEGRSLPLLVIGAPEASASAVRATGKTTVYVQGNIHAGEVCGKEALLMLLRRFAEGRYPSWADSLVLLVAPIYNADGNERIALTNRPRQHGPIGGMGQRPNAQGLDLNRDHTKLDSPEARSLVGLLNDYDPQVVVDLHTTNGTHHAYHITYSPPLHPNTPATVDTFLRDRWLPALTRSVRQKHGWDYYYYGNTFPRGGEPGWYTFDHRPRFNNNYAGLRNRMGILSEAYAYATFRDRVTATLWFVEELLDFATTNATEIREIVERADLTPVAGQRLALRAEPLRSPEPVTILMGEVTEERHPYTGRTILRRTDASVPTRMYEYGRFAPTETAVAPLAYFVLPEAEEAIERLEAHGIAFDRSTSEQVVTADRFSIDSTAVAQREFQGHRERTVWGRWVSEPTTLPPGTALISMDQPLGRLAFTLLEPRSDDGFVAWAILDEAIEEGRLPILRVPFQDGGR